jgi:phosphodiesterase/alkaline phosphatase D-like protein
MNKNIVIGLVAVAIIAGGVYLLSKNQSVDKTDTGNNTPVSATPSSPNPSVPAVVLSAPSVETNPNVSVSSSTALVSGQVIPNGVSTTYWFEYGETTGLGTGTSAQSIGSGFAKIATPFFITGLKANTNYYFRLSAKNNFGTVNGATHSFRTNNTPPPSGSVPTIRTQSATDISRTTANLRGEINPNRSETNYWFEYGKDTNLGNVSALETLASGFATVSIGISVRDLEPSTRYYFRLNAQNQYGTVNGSILNFTTSGPTAPGVPSATTNQASGITKTGATLNGRVNPNGAETTYWFEYSEDSLLGTILGGNTGTQIIPAGTSNVNVQTNVSGLKQDTRYYYRLVARNSAGTVQGSIVSFRTRN